MGKRGLRGKRGEFGKAESRNLKVEMPTLGALRPPSSEFLRYCPALSHSSPALLPWVWHQVACACSHTRESQLSSSTSTRPSSSFTSFGCQSVVWSYSSRSLRGWLNQSRLGSSSGIHSLMARQGGSMRLSVSMSKGGGGGLAKRTSPSHRP